MPGFFPPISLLNISVYRLQPRLFIDSLPYLKKNQKDLEEILSTSEVGPILALIAPSPLYGSSRTYSIYVLAIVIKA
jgi:hypothetical protein